MAKRGVVVTVDAVNLRKKVKRAIAHFGSKPLLRAIGLRYLSWIDENFRKEGKLSVGGWAPLSPYTTSRRRGTSYKILQDTGNLKNSYVSRVTLTEVIVGTAVEYAAKHEYGDPAANLPKRPMLPTVAQGEKMAVSVITAAVKKIDKG